MQVNLFTRSSNSITKSLPWEGKNGSSTNPMQLLKRHDTLEELRSSVPPSTGLQTAPEEIVALKKGLQEMKQRIESISLGRSDRMDHTAELSLLISDLENNRPLPFHWSPLGPERQDASGMAMDEEEEDANSAAFESKLSTIMPVRKRGGLWDHARRQSDTSVEVQSERQFNEGDIVVVKADLQEERKAQESATKRRKTAIDGAPKRFWLGKLLRFVGEANLLVHWYEGRSEFGQYRLIYHPSDKKNRFAYVR
jgi:hypothetical protein